MLRRLARAALSMLLCAALLFLPACSPGEKEAQEPVTAGFECDIAVQYQEMDIQGHLTRRSAGSLLLEITEPSTLNGLSMEWDGESITMKIHGLSFGVDPSALPESALGQGLLSALDAAIGQREERAQTQEGLATSGSITQGEFILVSDPETGSLLSLNIPAMGLTAEFSNFALTGAAGG
ncbi:MAG TPA: hypothetical protein H9694_08080 [Firmicutes bacterium]|nr:hypothetical protein [Bacillota bacterium]